MPQENAITVRIVDTRGSTPRDTGASLTVGTDTMSGSIGGGALEWEAIRIARDMIRSGPPELSRTFPLGPNLGQCCGGSVTLQFSALTAAAPRDALPVWIWGAGHVGRAIAATLAPLEGVEITLVDDSPDRMPNPLPEQVHPLVAADMPRAIAHAPQSAHHFILTYSHEIDFNLCDGLLQHGFEDCGLIGSATKWARFRKRLGQSGHSDAQISRITCPIGDPSLGKHPQAIAIGVAARLIDRHLREESAPMPTSGGI